MRLGDYTNNRLLALRAEVLASRLLLGLGTLQIPASPYGSRFGIVGVGIHSKPDEKLVVLVLSPIVQEGRIVPISTVPSIQNVIASITLPGEDWGDIYVWGVADPVENASTGDRIRGLKSGTAGAPVQWSSGTGHVHGILTAGHVTGSSTTVTARGGLHVGAVAACVLPSSGGIDVAVVALTVPSPSPRLTAVPVTGVTNIDLLTMPKVSGQIVAKTAWFHWPTYAVTYLDLYVTYSIISVGGDSGSATTLVGTSEFVGTLVGASSGSLIQDGRTQLGALSGLSGFTL